MKQQQLKKSLSGFANVACLFLRLCAEVHSH